MTLADIPTDDLVAEMERRLTAGTVGFAGLYSSNQMDYQEAWADVMDWLHDMCNADFDRWNPLRQVMIEAVARHDGDRIQSRRQVFAANTTYYGRRADEEHAPT